MIKSPAVRNKKSPAKRNGSKGLTRRERVESKEGAIVDAAYQLFGTKGFAKSTMIEIAKDAGVAEGTVYLYFQNKEALAGAVITKFYEQLTQTAKNGVAKLGNTASKLEFLAEHHLRSVIGEKQILDLLNVIDRRVVSQVGGIVYDLNKRYVAIFDSVVRDGASRGDIDNGYDAWVLRDIFYGGLEHAMRTIEITGRHREIKKFVRQIVRVLIVDENLKAGPAQQIDHHNIEKLSRRLEIVTQKLEGALPNVIEAVATKDI